MPDTGTPAASIGGDHAPCNFDTDCGCPYLCVSSSGVDGGLLCERPCPPYCGNGSETCINGFCD
jgi:hypothetical protein